MGTAVKKPKKSAVSKLKGARLAVYEALKARIDDPANALKVEGQLRLLDLGIGAYATQLPEVVVELLDEAAAISVADAQARAGALGKTWQDAKATLELQVRLVRARALWEAEKTADAALQLKQISASASSRRAELILAAAADGEDYSPTFSLALLRSAAGVLNNSLPAGLALVKAMAGAGEQPAAAMVLGQILAGRALWPDLQQSTLEALIEKFDPEHRATLLAQLGQG